MRLRDEYESVRYKLPYIFGAVGGPVPVSPPVAPPPPPGEPHLIGGTAGRAGSIWVSGALLRFASSDANEYGETGASQPTPPAPTAIIRSLYIDSGENFQYVDDSGVHRRPSITSLGGKPGGALLRAMRYDSGAPPTHPRARIQYAGTTNHFKWHNGF